MGRPEAAGGGARRRGAARVGGGRRRRARRDQIAEEAVHRRRRELRVRADGDGLGPLGRHHHRHLHLVAGARAPRQHLRVEAAAADGALLAHRELERRERLVLVLDGRERAQRRRVGLVVLDVLVLELRRRLGDRQRDLCRAELHPLLLERRARHVDVVGLLREQVDRRHDAELARLERPEEGELVVRAARVARRDRDRVAHDVARPRLAGLGGDGRELHAVELGARVAAAVERGHRDARKLRRSYGRGVRRHRHEEPSGRRSLTSQ